MAVEHAACLIIATKCTATAELDRTHLVRLRVNQSCLPAELANDGNKKTIHSALLQLKLDFALLHIIPQRLPAFVLTVG